MRICDNKLMEVYGGRRITKEYNKEEKGLFVVEQRFYLNGVVAKKPITLGLHNKKILYMGFMNIFRDALNMMRAMKSAFYQKQ